MKSFPWGHAVMMVAFSHCYQFWKSMVMDSTTLQGYDVREVHMALLCGCVMMGNHSISS
uniref:Uncharacterized protein n=1 Tax=Arundo donax TaxID=35708 RepID=A0A0A9BJI8_ARUDO